ncbi:MAG: hypothetical protein II328_04195 [Clostridia bacterium]|nr:hypothetical protein [Clostridia bacterium]
MKARFAGVLLCVGAFVLSMLMLLQLIENPMTHTPDVGTDTPPVVTPTTDRSPPPTQATSRPTSPASRA